MPRRGKTVRDVVEESVANVAADVAERLLESLRWARAPRQGADPFQVLGVGPDDPEELLRLVYRLKAKFYHPDNKDTGDPERFKQVVAAYELLTKLNVSDSSPR